MSKAPRFAAYATADGAGLLAKLGRVIKEKAQADIDRIFKARERVRPPILC